MKSAGIVAEFDATPAFVQSDPKRLWTTLDIELIASSTTSLGTFCLRWLRMGLPPVADLATTGH